MQLFRAVSKIELEDNRTYGGAFRDSRNLTGEKGFFYNLTDAVRMARSFEKMEGDPHTVVTTKAPDDLPSQRRQHYAAQEGPGVYLLQEDWERLSPAEEIES